MMFKLSEHLWALFGERWDGSDLVALFSLRLDEAGTDGRSPYTVVAGAVSTVNGWEALEASWRRLLARSDVPTFHWKQFNERSEPFAGWSKLKRDRFVRSMEKIIRENTLFLASGGVDRSIHADVKKRMKGIKGYRPDSDYSLCLRYLMFQTCEQLLHIDTDPRLAVMVEDGPWAKGALETYRRVSAMTAKRKPAKHAHRLSGFAVVPKGERPSLEAADYLAAQELDRMISGAEPKRNAQTLSVLFSEPELELYYRGMMKEKEARREFARQRANSAASSQERSS